WHEHLVVVRAAVVAVLVLVADLADDGVVNARDGDDLAESVAAGEELLENVVAEDRDTVYLPFVLPVELTAALQIERADVLIAGLDAVDVGRAVVDCALHRKAAALNPRRRDLHQPRLLAQDAGVLSGQRDATARALAPGLRAGSAAPDDRDVLAQLLQDVLVALTEALTSRRQDD